LILRESENKPATNWSANPTNNRMNLKAHKIAGREEKGEKAKNKKRLAHQQKKRSKNPTPDG
jgi:hypothetical protein